MIFALLSAYGLPICFVFFVDKGGKGAVCRGSTVRSSSLPTQNSLHRKKIQDSVLFDFFSPATAVSEIIDTVFAKTSPKCSFSMTEYARFRLVFTKTRVYKFGHGTFLKSFGYKQKLNLSFCGLTLI